MTKRLKILITIAIILALVLVYVWYSSAPNENEGKSVISIEGIMATSTSQEQLSQAKDILNVLSLLKTISLNLDFFDNAAFKSLYDFSVQLPVSEVGKTNPFAP
jgi:flagellar basal body-associated protein FliL